MKPVIVIPAYKPDSTLLSLVEALKPFQSHIIIVNDGSGEAFRPLFDSLKGNAGLTLLEHAVNLGKGQALKTAFNHFLIHFSNHSSGVITADADGQHLPKDIIKMSEEFTRHPHELILGIRTFSGNIPWKSQFGNRLTRFIFKLLIGQNVQDTQTGLRAIPKEFLKPLLKTTSNGYDFELDMLIMAAQEIKMRELPIETVYKDNNKGSHFNPLVDSLKIYFVFFRYLTFSIVSGLLDFFSFSFAFLITQNILLSESLARLFSGSCNFLFNKEIVFKSKDNVLPEASKYALLCAVNLVFFYALINGLTFAGVNVYASKMIALIGLFLANFAIQRLMIFTRADFHAPLQ